MRQLLLFGIFLISTINLLHAQPLQLGWEKELVGNWRVLKIDSTQVPEGVNMFLEIQPNVLRMVGPQGAQNGKWRVLPVERKILVKTNQGTEAWEVTYLDSTRLTIYDTLDGGATIYMERFDNRAKKDPLEVKATASDLVGIWLFVSLDGQVLPRSNIKLDLLANGDLRLQAGNDVQTANWHLNEAQTRIVLEVEGTEPVDWIITEINSKSLSIIDKGAVMRFTRSTNLILEEDLPKLQGKWVIQEISGVAPPQDQPRGLNIQPKGKLTFFTGEQTEKKGAWGLTNTKNALFITTDEDTETWKVLYLSEAALLLEMNELKMLLRKI